MGNIKVLQASSLTCGCSTVIGNQFENPADQILVRHKPGTQIGNVIKPYNENGKKVYELDDLALIEPILVFTNDAGLREVGETVAVVIFSGSITAGTFPIASRQITPDPGGLDLTAPFNFQKLNVKRTTPGVAQTHTLTAIDDEGNTVNKVSEVPFKNAVYQGFNASPTLTQAQIKALVNKDLVDSLPAEYEGLKDYVVPGSDPKYIYWAGPVGSPVLGGALLNGFTLPLTDVGPISVTNPHDVLLNLSYWVKRTSAKFDPGTYQIEI